VSGIAVEAHAFTQKAKLSATLGIGSLGVPQLSCTPNLGSMMELRDENGKRTAVHPRLPAEAAPV
jgi:hypothetical protein